MKFCNKIYLNLFVLLMALFGAASSAITLEDMESITALVRIPAVIGANTVGKEKQTYSKVMLIVADVIRFSNEALSIVNKRGENDFHHYDYLWGLYDIASLYLHVKNLIGYDNNANLSESDKSEYAKFQGMLLTLHESILPVIEGTTAYLAAANTGKLATDGKIRLICKSINSMTRLIDNIIVSKTKSREQLLYAGFLGLNILLLVFEASEYYREQVCWKTKQHSKLEKEKAVPALRFKTGSRHKDQREEDLDRWRAAREEENRHMEEERHQETAAHSDNDHKKAPIILNDNQCSICLNNINVGDKCKRLNCSHAGFHSDCLPAECIGKCPNCPMCRAVRVLAEEADIFITQEMLDELNKKESDDPKKKS